jgi:hypothetical protein
MAARRLRVHCHCKGQMNTMQGLLDFKRPCSQGFKVFVASLAQGMPLVWTSLVSQRGTGGCGFQAYLS